MDFKKDKINFSTIKYTEEEIEIIRKAFLDYIPKAARTLNRLEDITLDQDHMNLGYVTELAEIADILKKHIAYNKEIDFVNLKEEIGDIAWYLACNMYMFSTNLNEDSKVIFNNNSLDFTSSLTDNVYSITDYIFIMYNIVTTHIHVIMYNLWLGLCKILGMSTDDIIRCLNLNINKLKVRYPEKFTDVLALDRDLDAERNTLEN